MNEATSNSAELSLLANRLDELLDRFDQREGTSSPTTATRMRFLSDEVSRTGDLFAMPAFEIGVPS